MTNGATACAKVLHIPRFAASPVLARELAYGAIVLGLVGNASAPRSLRHDHESVRLLRAIPANVGRHDRERLFFHGGGSLEVSLLEGDGHVRLAVTTLPGFMAAADLCDENFGYESVPAFREAELLEEPGEPDPALRIAKYDESLTDADFKPDILSGRACGLCAWRP